MFKEIKTKYYQGHFGAIHCSTGGSQDTLLTGRQIYELDLLLFLEVNEKTFKDWYGLKPNELYKMYSD
jgi:hypothetical protein